MQTMEIVRGELIVRDLSARELIVGKPVMAAVRRQPVSRTELVVSAEFVIVSRECMVVSGEIVLCKAVAVVAGAEPCGMAGKAGRVAGWPMAGERMGREAVPGKRATAQRMSGEGMSA